MGISIKIEPIDRDLVLRLIGTPAQRSSMLADFAREKLAEAEQINANALGFVPAHQTFVDQAAGASEDTVRPDGVIVYEFELVTETLAWIDDQLKQHSPVGSGRDPHPGLYKKSHVLLADGAEVPDGAEPPAAQEYVFLNVQPYARILEKRAADGIYEAVASLARSRFSNIAKIGFTYRPASFGAVAEWAGSASARVHAANHRRQGNKAASWLANQPAIVVSTKV